MRWYYWVLIAAFSTVYVVLFFTLKSLSPGQAWVSQAINMGGVFVALGAAMVALGAANRPPQFVNFQVKTWVGEKEISVHHPKNLPSQEIEQLINLGFGICKSYQVYFRITNISGFTLKTPVFTFKLSKDFMHPHKTRDGRWIRYYRSNIYMVHQEASPFHYENFVILSNTILPYVNADESIDIWIRMCLTKPDPAWEGIKTSVSVNCANAEGKTQLVTVCYERLPDELKPAQESLQS